MKEKEDRISVLIEEALRKAPDFELEEGFEDRVIKRIHKKETRKQWGIYIFMAFATLTMLGYGYASIVPYLDFNASIFNNVSQFVPIAALLGCVIVVIQWMDRKLVKDRMLRKIA